MARVVSYQSQIQRDMPTPGRLQSQDFGPGALATGLSIAGKGLSVIADQQDELQKVHDEIAAKEAVTATNGHYAEEGYTGPNAYYMTGGKAALDRKPEFEKNLGEFIDKARQGLSPRQRQIYDATVDSQRQTWAIQSATHADKETKTYDIGETQSSMTMAGELAKNVWTEDPADSEKQLGVGLAQIDRLGALSDWGPAQIAKEKLKFTSGIYRDIGQTLIIHGDRAGPELADSLVEKHGGSMIADDRNLLANASTAQRRSFQAEDRRAEAELARQAHEARSDAKDRAQSVLRNISDGVPVDATTLATAMTDATTAEDPGLVEGLRQGGLKNQLTQTYAGAAPVELQNHINELSAQITREGAKVKPDTVVERDHLAKLLYKTNSEIKDDPLSWGAKAMGIDPGQLNLNDPNSITKRMNFASAVTRRTGRVTPPISSEEATLWGSLVVNGSAAQRTSLALQLAHFGPLAATAVRQVAPDNPGFQNLVGLAGHQNQAVGRSLVSRVIEGQAVLAQNKGLIQQDEALQQYQGMTGQAFQFLPTVSAGVYDNAKAIAASEAARTGKHEWAEISGKTWFRAVNSALGAYTHDGQQVGGLHQFNGGWTILPENVSETDFEARIARAHGPQFRAAQNGDPVFASGKSPIAADVKKMQWVPVSDGLYAIGDGQGAFLQTKNGSRYTIDVRKLR